MVLSSLVVGKIPIKRVDTRSTYLEVLFHIFLMVKLFVRKMEESLRTKSLIKNI